MLLKQMTIRVLTLAAVAVLCGADSALAQPVSASVSDATGDAMPVESTTLVWTFSGVTFDDGGVASGAFEYNAATQTAVDWDISTTAGSTLEAFNYTLANSTFSRLDAGDPQIRMTFSHSGSIREFRITPTQALTAAGGAVALDLNTGGGGSGGVECFNCSRPRLITAGSISASAAPPSPEEHQIDGVLDAAGGQTLISPGSIVSVFGDFTDITATSAAIPLGEDLNGFSVTFNDVPGALFGVFDGAFDQSNVQVPWSVDVSSGKVEVKVHWEDESGEIWSEPFEVDAALASPGIYMFPPGTTQAIVTNFKQEGDDVIAGSWAQPADSIPGVVSQPAAIGGRGDDLVRRSRAGQPAACHG